MRQLRQNAAALVMDRIAQHLIAGNNIVVQVPQGIATGAEQARFVHGGTTGNLQTNAVMGIVAMICDVLFAGFIILGKPRHVGRNQDAVADLGVADLKRREEVRELAHRGVSSIRAAHNTG